MENSPHEELPQAGASSTALPRRGFDQDTNLIDTEPVAHLSDKQEQEQDGPMDYQPLSPIYGKLPTKTSIRLIDLDASCVPCLPQCDICENEISNVIFHCGICNEGDFDMCRPCKDDGAYCLDHHHALIKRALNNDMENPVMELSYCMHTFDLDAPVSFRALSYTWDSPYQDVLTGEPIVQPEVPRYVSCNMTLLPVKQNLHDALKTFKEFGIGGLLWVDALCINQADLDERATQVALMGQLFSVAREVLAWLGPPEKGFKDLVWAIQQFLPAFVYHLEPRTPTAHSVLDPSVGAALGLEDVQIRLAPHSVLDPSFGAALVLEDVRTRLANMALFYASCRWFTRAWVVQEVTLAKNAVILCGPEMVRLDELGVLADLLRKTEVDLRICSYLRYRLKGKGYKRRVPFSFFEEVFKWRKLFVIDPWKEYFLGHNRDIAWLWLLIHQSRRTQCADERDHIYSILGMAATKFTDPSTRRLIVPDYKISTQDLFTRVTKIAVEREDCRPSGLPSWVPDYTHPIDWSLLDRKPNGQKFDTTSSHSFGAEKHTVSMSTLTCSGALFEVVTEVAPMDCSPSHSWKPEDWKSCFAFCGCESPKPESNARFEELWRTLVFDSTYLYENPAPACYKEYFLDFIRYTFTNGFEPRFKKSSELYRIGRSFASLTFRSLLKLDDAEHRDDAGVVQTIVEQAREHKSGILPYGKSERLKAQNRALDFEMAMARVRGGRCLFKTERLHLGNGPYHIQGGDQVWVIFNARMPFVLRPTGNANEFNLVGDCYMQGFMHGEMLDDQYGLKERIKRINIV
jgi:hypothetical protein